MDIQSIFSYGIGLFAFFYSIRIFVKKFKLPHVEPKCNSCIEDKPNQNQTN